MLVLVDTLDCSLTPLLELFLSHFICFQGTKEEYEKCITATKEAWQVWADVSLALVFIFAVI